MDVSLANSLGATTKKNFGLSIWAREIKPVGAFYIEANDIMHSTRVVWLDGRDTYKAAPGLPLLGLRPSIAKGNKLSRKATVAC